MARLTTNWTEEDDKRLIEYVAVCHQNQLPDRKVMQKLLKKCLEVYSNGHYIHKVKTRGSYVPLMIV